MTKVLHYATWAKNSGHTIPRCGAREEYPALTRDWNFVSCFTCNALKSQTVKAERTVIPLTVKIDKEVTTTITLTGSQTLLLREALSYLRRSNVDIQLRRKFTQEQWDLIRELEQGL